MRRRSRFWVHIWFSANFSVLVLFLLDLRIQTCAPESPSLLNQTPPFSGTVIDMPVGSAPVALKRLLVSWCPLAALSLQSDRSIAATYPLTPDSWRDSFDRQLHIFSSTFFSTSVGESFGSIKAKQRKNSGVARSGRTRNRLVRCDPVEGRFVVAVVAC